MTGPPCPSRARRAHLGHATASRGGRRRPLPHALCAAAGPSAPPRRPTIARPPPPLHRHGAAAALPAPHAIHGRRHRAPRGPAAACPPQHAIRGRRTPAERSPLPGRAGSGPGSQDLAPARRGEGLRSAREGCAGEGTTSGRGRRGEGTMSRLCSICARAASGEGEGREKSERERERERKRVRVSYILLSATGLNWASIGPIY